MNREERQAKIDAYRKAQPIEELRRKYLKCLGRNHRAFWQAEEIDLADAEAKELIEFFNKNPWQ